MSGTSSDFAFPSRQAAPMPFPLMTLRSLKVLSLLALLTAPALLTAQVEIRVRKRTKRGEQGEVTIAFGSLDELNGLIEKLRLQR